MKIERFLAILRYLKWVEPVYSWKIGKGNCPLCGRTFFLSMKADPFFTRCIKCKATITNLAIIPAVKEHLKEKKDPQVYELSTYGATLDYLKKNYNQITTSEYMPEYEKGIIVNNILNQDVQCLTFEDASFDCITSNQVFEHVPDDIAGYRECYRVLKASGVLIFTVPFWDIKETRKIALIENGKIVYTGKPEYHDSRISGPKSAPVFYNHSINDICNRVQSAGFSSVYIKDIILIPLQEKPQKVIIAIK